MRPLHQLIVAGAGVAGAPATTSDKMAKAPTVARRILLVLPLSYQAKRLDRQADSRNVTTSPDEEETSSDNLLTRCASSYLSSQAYLASHSSHSVVRPLT